MVFPHRGRWEGVRIPFLSLLRPRPAAALILMVMVAYGLVSSAPSANGRLGLVVEIIVVAAGVLLVYAVAYAADARARPARLRSEMRESGFRGLVGMRENQAGR